MAKSKKVVPPPVVVPPPPHRPEGYEPHACADTEKPPEAPPLPQQPAGNAAAAARGGGQQPESESWHDWKEVSGAASKQQPEASASEGPAPGPAPSDSRDLPVGGYEPADAASKPQPDASVSEGPAPVPAPSDSRDLPAGGYEPHVRRYRRGAAARPGAAAPALFVLRDTCTSEHAEGYEPQAHPAWPGPPGQFQPWLAYAHQLARTDPEQAAIYMQWVLTSGVLGYTQVD